MLAQCQEQCGPVCNVDHMIMSMVDSAVYAAASRDLHTRQMAVVGEMDLELGDRCLHPLEDRLFREGISAQRMKEAQCRTSDRTHLRFKLHQASQFTCLAASSHHVHSGPLREFLLYSGTTRPLRPNILLCIICVSDGKVGNVFEGEVER